MSHGGIRLVDTAEEFMRDELRSAGFEGQALVDLSKVPRIRVHFRSSFSAGQLVGGEGTLIDLTREGCRVKSDVRVQPGSELELLMYVPAHDLLIVVELAAVRWAKEGEFGLEFVRMRSEAKQLLHQVIKSNHTDTLQ